MAETIDCLVVGAGMAGLTAGALLARAGKRVAVFEKHGKLGGYAQYFGQDPTFDAATHLIGGCGPRGWVTELVDQVGISDRVELIPCDPVYHAVFPRHSYSAAADPERFRQELCTLWPSEAAAIGRFFADVEAMGRDYLTLAGDAPAELLRVHHEQTLDAYLDEYTRNQEVRAALGALWIYGGLPPARLSAVHYAMLWHQFQVQGSGAVRGGVKVLTQALADVITEHGGVVETRVRVAQLRRRGGKVTGARLEDGRELETGAIISTASPHDTFEELLFDEEQKPAGYPALRSFATSISAMQVHLLVDGPLQPAARTTLLHTTYDLNEAFFDLQRDEPDYAALVCSVLDYNDPSRAPEGSHILSLFTLAPYGRMDNWSAPFDSRRGPEYRALEEYRALKDELGDAIVARAEDLFPGLSQRVRARKVGTPLTLERYTFNTGGAAFGWAHVPEQSGAARPGPETPFRGLFMAGHWTFPGGGVAPAMVSGRLAAEAVLRTG
ncbi:MAG: phytoene desaturase family protein [Armatimonadota bacterium]